MWGGNRSRTAGSTRRANHKRVAIVLKTSSANPRWMLLAPDAKRWAIGSAKAGRPGGTISASHGRDGVQLRLVEATASISFLSHCTESGLGLRQFLTNASEVGCCVERSHFDLVFCIERLPNRTVSRLRTHDDSTTLVSSTAKWICRFPKHPPALTTSVCWSVDGNQRSKSKARNHDMATH